MPLHSDFQKMHQAFVKQYGSDKGDNYFWARINKCGYDETKPLAGQKCKVEELERSVHPDFAPVFYSLVDFYGLDKGVDLYGRWVNDNKFDDATPLNTQLGHVWESFDWLPIKFRKKEADGATLYDVKCVHVGVSVNRNKYKLEELQWATRSLCKKMLNLNHDHRLRLPYPENRVTKYVDFVDYWVEALIRVADPDVQRLIDAGIIKYPSIEWDSWDTNPAPANGLVWEPDHLMFDELALLTDVLHPGVPISRINPFRQEAVNGFSDPYAFFPAAHSGAVLLESIISRSQKDEVRKEIEPMFATENKKEWNRRMSELYGETWEVIWTQAYQNELPDSAFLWIHPDYKSGKSKDKALRKLPVYDATGKLDKAHVVAAYAALKGARGGVDIPASDRASLIKRVLGYYSKLGLEQPEESAFLDMFLQLIEGVSAMSITSLQTSTKETAKVQREVTDLRKQLDDFMAMVRLEKVSEKFNRVRRRLSDLETKMTKRF